jgi:hypothetical protein
VIPQTTQVTIRDAVRAALAGTPTPTPAPKPAPTPTTPVLGLAAAGLYDVASRDTYIPEWAEAELDSTI